MIEANEAATTLNDSIGGETRQVVQSPEQVALHLPIAGPTSRMLAYSIDYLGITLVTGVLIALLLFAAPIAAWALSLLEEVGNDLQRGDFVGVQTSEAFMLIVVGLIILQVFVEWLYFIVSEVVSGGRSPGKAIVGLRVVADGGLPLTVQQSMVRNFLRAVDILPASYLVGLISMVLSPEGKRLGDIAAGTVVIRIDRAPTAAPVAADEPTGEAFRFDREQIERVAGAELALARQTLRRIGELPADVGEPMLERAVETIRARVGYGPVEKSAQRAFLQALLYAARSR